MRKALSHSVRSEACRVDFSRRTKLTFRAERKSQYTADFILNMLKNYLVYFKAIFQKLKRFCVCDIKHTA